MGTSASQIFIKCKQESTHHHAAWEYLCNRFCIVPTEPADAHTHVTG